MEKNLITKPQESPHIDNPPSLCQLIATRELSEKLGISRRAFYLRRKEIEPFIPPIKIGERSIRYRLSDVINFIERGGFYA